MKYTKENVENIRFSIGDSSHYKIMKNQLGELIIYSGSHTTGIYTNNCGVIVKSHISSLNSGEWVVIKEPLLTYEIY